MGILVYKKQVTATGALGNNGNGTAQHTCPWRRQARAHVCEGHTNTGAVQRPVGTACAVTQSFCSRTAFLSGTGRNAVTCCLLLDRAALPNTAGSGGHGQFSDVVRKVYRGGVQSPTKEGRDPRKPQRAEGSRCNHQPRRQCPPDTYERRHFLMLPSLLCVPFP